MIKSSKKFTTIDEYISLFTKDIQVTLNKFREVIRSAAPEAMEAIKYQMPTFVLNGNLVHFAVLKNHFGFYPTPSGIEAYKKELAEFVSTKGAIQFSKDKPIPFDLVRKIVEFRVKENLGKKN